MQEAYQVKCTFEELHREFRILLESITTLAQNEATPIHAHAIRELAMSTENDDERQRRKKKKKRKRKKKKIKNKPENRQTKEHTRKGMSE
jgi:hypothetical protein